MAIVVKDRVKVTVQTSGLADFTLDAAVVGFQDFGAIGDGNSTYYAAVDAATGDWEVGLGTYSSAGPTLTRTTILESSAAGNKVSFFPGSKDLFCTYPAERSVYLGAAASGSYTVGDILYASGPRELSNLPDVVAGNVLLSGGIETAPSWGKVDLATHVSGTLPAANGGTGVTGSTGTGNVVLSISPTINTPTLIAPALGTPTALIGTNITGTASALSVGGSSGSATNIKGGLVNQIPHQSAADTTKFSPNFTFNSATGTLLAFNGEGGATTQATLILGTSTYGTNRITTGVDDVWSNQGLLIKPHRQGSVGAGGRTGTVTIEGGDTSGGTYALAGGVNILGGGTNTTNTGGGLYGDNGPVNITGGPGSGSTPRGGWVTITGGAGNAAAGGVSIVGGSGTGGGSPIVFSTSPTTTSTQRLKILNNGAWSVGTDAVSYGTSGQVLMSNGNAAPTWQSIPPTSTSVSKNHVTNGNMAVAQRGDTAVTTSSAYGPADRWINTAVGDTFSTTRSELVSGDTLYNSGGARYCTTVALTSVLAATNYVLLSQLIEDVRRLAGQTVTLSFWAKGAAGTPLIGMSIDQNFGAGGSPSAAVNGTGQSQLLSTTWTKYTKTFTIPSISGKVIGTSENSSFTQLNFWLNAGTNFNARSGTSGQSSKTVSIAQVQLEISATATAFEMLPSGADLSLCKRYYQRIGAGSLGYQFQGYQDAGSEAGESIFLGAAMRAAPTATKAGTWTVTNCGQPSFGTVTDSIVQIKATATALGPVSFSTADSTTYIELNAELVI